MSVNFFMTFTASVFFHFLGSFLCSGKYNNQFNMTATVRCAGFVISFFVSLILFASMLAIVAAWFLTS